MNYQITYEKNPKSEDIQILNDGIMEEAKEKKGMKQLDFFAFFIRDENGKIIGGCGGDNMYGGLYVGQLWVTESLRGKGYGTQLMKKAETLAKESKCNFIAVNTFDWEALDFYKNLGFYVEFERRGFDKDSIFYFLRKEISKSATNTTKHFKIQLVEPDLAEKICCDITADLPGYFGIPEANERYAKGMRDRVSFAASVDNQYVGLLTLEFPFTNNANVYWMAVKNKHQGQKLGSLLVEKAVEYCREKGYSSLTVETLSPKNENADYLKTYQFYERCHFRPLFELNTYSSDCLMVYMQKSI